MGMFDGALMGIFTGGAGNQSEAADDARHAAFKFQQDIGKAQGDFEDFSTDYQEQFQELNDDFDPLDLQKEFDLLYEAVILPMERDFSEKVLPQIRQGYSGGGYGSSLFSGGREVAEAEGRQNLSMNSALLRMQGREAGIQRNFQEYDRRSSNLGLQYDIGSRPLQQAFTNAGSAYGAKSDSIAAQSAAGQAWGNLGPRIAGSIAGFFGGGGNNQTTDNATVGKQDTGAGGAPARAVKRQF